MIRQGVFRLVIAVVLALMGPAVAPLVAGADSGGSLLPHFTSPATFGHPQLAIFVILVTLVVGTLLFAAYTIALALREVREMHERRRQRTALPPSESRAA